MILLIILCFAVGYFLGSINGGLLVSLRVYKQDIRTMGSKNAGMTNMLRCFGKKAAVLTLLIDFLKGIIAVLIAGLIMKISNGAVIFGAVAAGTGAILGHNFPVFFGFKGGKGVLTTFSVCVMIMPVPSLIALGVFAVFVAIFDYVSLGSIMAALSLPISLFFFGGSVGAMNGLSVCFYFALFAAILLIARHHANIGRLFRGQESHLFRKKKEIKNE